MNSIGGSAPHTADFLPGASLSNYEISALQAGFDPRNCATVRDFTLKNAQDVRSSKINKIQPSKEQIELVHGHLREGFGIVDELINLNRLEMHLPQHMHGSFLNNHVHGNLLGSLLALNESFVPVLEYLVCYKAEIGLCLQRMVESYNLLLLMQFSGFYSMENSKVKEYTEKAKVLEEKMAELEKQR